jgi:histidyl-tRNA synthetase
VKYNAPKYMNDVLPVARPDKAWLHSARWRAVERVFQDVCRLYGYREIRTPVMESTELFTRSIGEGTDIVSKEMFSFETRGGAGVTLRPEGTAPVIRAYLENGLASEGSLTKLYYIARVYRYERGQKGRYREHQQTGVEVLGSAEPLVDAEVISLAVEFYRRLGIADTELRINSVGCPLCRPAYREQLLDFARPLLDQMSADNRTRFATNPLRMLDSKEPQDRQALQDAPRLVDALCEGCAAHFAALCDLLRLLEIPFSLDPHLVRGFDYYTRTAFEVVSRGLGAMNAIGGGGRYDGLVEECGGPATPGIGFGIGTERCLIALESAGIDLPIDDEAPVAFLVAMGPGERARAARLLLDLRRAGVSCDADYGARSMKAQMRQASRLGARWAVILGEDELSRGACSLKDLQGGAPQCETALASLVERLSQ